MKQTKTLERIIETTVETAQPEKILLVGSYEYKKHITDIGIGSDEHSEKQARYDLLVLVNHDTGLDILAEKIEERARILGDVAAQQRTANFVYYNLDVFLSLRRGCQNQS
jgi:ribonucleotide monophosphatase NagD (HAD superfamily)